MTVFLEHGVTYLIHKCSINYILGGITRYQVGNLQYLEKLTINRIIHPILFGIAIYPMGNLQYHEDISNQ